MGMMPMVAIQEPLTDREIEILQHMAEGLSNREIAAQLFISLETVKWYNKRIFEKMNVSNRDDAVAYARSHHLLTNVQAKHNLPTQTTPFVGREQEIRTLSTLLNTPTVRLITILGPGGMGKTRLAQEVGLREVDSFTDGVYFVSLAALSSIEVIVSAVGEVLSFAFAENMDAKRQLLGYLRDKDLLLVLDNYEHLLDGATLVSDMLSAAPQVKILTTSRERLNLVEESLFRIEGLPSHGEENPLESDAVRLFMQSATRIRPGFRLQPHQIALVTHICQQVQGMPLAILLAAAWIATLSIEEIAAEIDHSLDFLAADMRNLPERFQSIRAVFNSAWKMLAADEQRVFMKLAVFRGGFERSAAVEVAGASLYALINLDNKSLLHRNPFTGRYEIHELLRHYAEEKLNESGERQAVHDAHCHFYMNFIERRDADIKGRRQLEAYNEIDIEFDNVFAAWVWACEQRYYDLVGQTMEVLELYCNRNHWSERGELYRHAEKNLAPKSNEPVHPVWGRMMSRWAGYLYYSGLLPTIDMAKAIVQAGIEQGRQENNLQQIAEGLWNMGDLMLGEQDYAGGAKYHEECLPYYERLGDEYAIAWVVHALGWSYTHLGQTERGLETTTRSLELMRHSGDKIGQTYALNNIGVIALIQGKYTLAKRCFEEALSFQRELVIHSGIGWNYASLALIAAIQGELEEAHALAMDAYTIQSRQNYDMGAGYGAAVLGLIANVRGNYAQAREHTAEARPSVIFNPEIVFILDWNDVLSALGMGELAAAKHAFLSMMEYALKRQQSYGAMTICLAVAALLAFENGKLERAAKLLGLAYAHPAGEAGWMDACPLFAPVRQQVENTSAWEQGKLLDLDTLLIGEG